MALKNEVLDKMTALMTAAFGLVAALAWNDAIKSLFVEGGPLFFMAKYGVWAYAILVTLLVVFVTLWISKAAAKTKHEN